MQALYILLGAMAVLIPGLFIVSMFLPATVKVRRTRVIPASPSRLFEQVNVLRNWERWSPWHQVDPTMQLKYNETSSGAGARYTWQSKHRQVGKGSMTITESRPDEFIATDMQFMEQGAAKASFRFEPVNNGTLVTWEVAMNMGQRPVRKLMGLMMDKWVGKDFERGLENLEKLVK
ncbi:SRPBCC family protein [Chitinophaga tropicalis]|nr:SRPBCC family protein [Chitinophaga tropicalis]